MSILQQFSAASKELRQHSTIAEAVKVVRAGPRNAEYKDFAADQQALDRQASSSPLVRWAKREATETPSSVKAVKSAVGAR